jgi:CheY-like chemotaxis protein
MERTPPPNPHPTDDTLAPKSQKTWPVLLVDDDEDIHKLTALVLRRFSFEGKTVELFHAYDGQEARAIFAQRNYALVIVDVVMETDTAGFDFIAWLRSQPIGQDTRIVLRTGQPGRMEEEDLAESFDVDDVWYKTELNTRQIRDGVSKMLRAYKLLQGTSAPSISP